LQLVPPFALLVGELLGILKNMTVSRKVKQSAGEQIGRSLEVLTSAVLIFVFVSGLILLNVRPYATFSYYQRFYMFLTGQMTGKEYRNSFEALMPDNYAAAKIISAAPGNHLFIWGTDPGLYALSRKSPVGRFTVLFHIKDFQAEHETYLDLVRVKPIYAVVIKGETVPDEIKVYLEQNYIPNLNYEHFILWKKIPT
jgi:hypothetical protein